jgi:hypothetical protein
MIRQLVTPEGGPIFVCNIGVALIDLCTIATYSLMLRQQGTGGTVCGSKSDLGSMYALGTTVLLDCVNTCEYAANSMLPCDLLRQFVEAMARAGSFCFPKCYGSGSGHGGPLWFCAG